MRLPWENDWVNSAAPKKSFQNPGLKSFKNPCLLANYHPIGLVSNDF